MKYIALILLASVAAFGQQKSFKVAHERNQPEVRVGAKRTNVVATVKLTKLPARSKDKLADLYVRVFDGTNWSVRSFRIAGTNTTSTFNVPVAATAKQKKVTALLLTHQDFEAVVEIK